MNGSRASPVRLAIRSLALRQTRRARREQDRRASRRSQRIAATAGIAALALAAGSGPARGLSTLPETDEPRPNILVIVTDDQREGLEVMPKTLSWFRDEGVEYTNAFVTTPLCCPSRASIFSGRYAHNTGVKTNHDAAALDQQTTVQHYLHEAGYRTGIFGKFLNSWPLDDDPPNFDEWATFSKSDPSYSGGQWNVQGTVTTVDEYATQFIGDHAASFIEADSSGPWFLYLAPPNPHDPFTPEPQYESAAVPPWEGNPAVFEEDRSDKPPYVQSSSRTFEAASETRTKQLRTLMSVDDMIERVMATLAATDQLDNTLAFLISDNGLMWAEHGLGGKRVPYPQAVKVPFFARWSAVLPGGTANPRLVANIDIAPTALESAGIVPAAPMDGRSLLTAHDRDRMLLEQWADEDSSVPTWASLVTDVGQYVEYYDDAGAVSFTEYYDLVNDPWQLDNLFEPPIGLAEQLEADRSCVSETCP